MSGADARREDDRIKLLAREVLPLDQAISTKTMAMVVHVMDDTAFSGIASGLKRDGDGKQKLLLKMHVQTHEVVLELPGSYKLSQGFASILNPLMAWFRLKIFFCNYCGHLFSFNL